MLAGGESLIDGKEGFIKAMASDLYEKHCDENGNLDGSKLSQFIDINLNKFHINNIYLKKYPFCRHIHSAIDSTLVLKNEWNDLKNLDDLKIDYSDISSIDIETYRIASEHDNYNPKNEQDLKQSLPYAVAIALVLDDLSLDSIDKLIENGLFDEKSSDKDILKIKEIVSKINIKNNEEFNQMTPEKRPSKVTIKFSEDSYEILEETTYYPLGEVENPLKEDDVLEKFKILNPKFNRNKLQIIKHMENYSIQEVFEELDLLD